MRSRFTDGEKAVGLSTDRATLSYEGLTGHEVAREQPPIVKKIENEEVDELRARFAGKLAT